LEELPEALLSSPWFERAWTFQEVAVSTTETSGAIAMFGNGISLVRLHDFRNGIGLIRSRYLRL